MAERVGVTFSSIFNDENGYSLPKSPIEPHSLFRGVATAKARTRRQALIENAEAYFNIEGAHRADAPVRRRKTRQELIDSHELIELYDRDHPGKLAGRRGT
jgi:hypothetical protein